MTSIEEKVVAIKLNYQQFVDGTKKASEAIKNLDSSLTFSEKAKAAFKAISDSAKQVDLQPLTDKPKEASKAFQKLENIATVAMGNITAKIATTASSAVFRFLKKPISDGYNEYKNKLESVQTILANTKSKGESIGSVTKVLNDLNTYSDKTIYNFGQMTQNLGKFTAAGVGLKESASAIKGLSNVAALFGVNSEEAGRAMYQLSQAIASGTVRLQDWNSIENANMGGETFKKALIETAKVQGVKVDEMIKKDGSFRESLKEGWLTSKVMLQTLSQFAGDYSEKQLRAMGYTARQAHEIISLSKTAMHAAQDIKSFTQLLDVVEEAVGSGWAQIFELIVGNYEEAKVLWTNVGNSIQDSISNTFEGVIEVLQKWHDAGGRMALFEGLGSIIKALLAPLQALKNALTNVFPRPSAESLVEGTKAFAKFAKTLVPSERQVKALTTALTVLLMPLRPLMKIIGILLKILIGTLYGVLYGITSLLYSLAEGIYNAYQWVVKMVAKLIDWVKNLSSVKAIVGVVSSSVSAFRQEVAKAWASISKIISGVRISSLKAISDVLRQISSEISKLFKALGARIQPHLSDWADKSKAKFDSLGKSINAWIQTLQPRIEEFAKSASDKLSSIGDTLTDKVSKSFASFGKFLEDKGILTTKTETTIDVSGDLIEMDKLDKKAKSMSIGDRLKEIPKQISNAFVEIQKLGVNGVANAIVKLVEAIPKAIEKLFTTSGGVTTKVGAFVNSIMESMKALGSSLHAGLQQLKKVYADRKSILRKWQQEDTIFGDAVRLFTITIPKYYDKMVDGLRKGIANIKRALQDFGSEFMKSTKDQFKGLNIGELFAGTLVGTFAYIIAMSHKFMKNLTNTIGSIGDAFESIGGAFSAFGDHMKAMQNNVKARTILTYAIAIGLLAASLIALAQVPAQKLGVSLAIVVGGLAALMGTMMGMQKVLNGKGGLGNLQLITLATALIGIAIAMRFLSGALKSLADVKPQQLMSGALALSAIIAGLVLLMNSLSRFQTDISAGEIMATSVSLIALGVAINLIAKAVIKLGEMEPKKMMQGALAMTAIVGGLIVFTKVANQKIDLGNAMSILIVAVALSRIGTAIGDFAEMPWGEFLSGTTKAGLVLGAIAGLMWILPPSAFAASAALLTVAISLKAVAFTISSYAQMPWGEYLSGITKMGATIVALGLALTFMENGGGGLKASVTLIALGIALRLFAGGLDAMSKIPFGALVGSLMVLAVGLAAVIAAGMLASGAAVGLMALSVAMLAFGGAVALVGLGVSLLAAGFVALAAAGTASAMVILGFISGLLLMLPLFGTMVGQMIVNLAAVLAGAGPTFTALLTTIITSMLMAVTNSLPKFYQLVTKLVDLILRVLRESVPKLVQTGMSMLIGLLNGIANNIGKVVKAGANIIVNFLNGISNELPRITNAGANLIISFVNSVANTIRNKAAEMRAAARNIGSAIIEGITAPITEGVQTVVNAAKNVVKGAVDGVKKFLGINSPSKVFMRIGFSIIEGLTKGVHDKQDDFHNATIATARESFKAMSKAVDKELKDYDNYATGPIITPVIDMSEVRSGFKEIGRMSETTNLALGFGERQLRAIESLQEVKMAAKTNSGAGSSERQINFTQNNYSPKALSEIEIYRQTRNQLRELEGVR